MTARHISNSLVRLLAEENDGEMKVTFCQSDFLRAKTDGIKGVCLQLSLKWATEKIGKEPYDFVEKIYRNEQTKELREL